MIHSMKMRLFWQNIKNVRHLLPHFTMSVNLPIPCGPHRPPTAPAQHCMKITLGDVLRGPFPQFLPFTVILACQTCLSCLRLSALYHLCPSFLYLHVGGSKVTADADGSHEIKRSLLLERKAVTNLDSRLKSRNIHYFADKDLSSQSYDFSSSHVWMWELDHKEG